MKGRPVANGEIVRLEHCNTHGNLHSHPIQLFCNSDNRQHEVSTLTLSRCVRILIQSNRSTGRTIESRPFTYGRVKPMIRNTNASANESAN
jgi:dolichyl-phosphate-mannose--protein O-mannosyl transferase